MNLPHSLICGCLKRFAFCETGTTYTILQRKPQYLFMFPVLFLCSSASWYLSSHNYFIRMPMFLPAQPSVFQLTRDIVWTVAHTQHHCYVTCYQHSCQWKMMRRLRGGNSGSFYWLERWRVVSRQQWIRALSHIVIWACICSTPCWTPVPFPDCRCTVILLILSDLTPGLHTCNMYVWLKV